MKQRYLITGGAGFIGSHLCDAIVARGDQVVVVDNFSSGKSTNLASSPGAQIIEGDIRSADLAALGRFDACIHLAALISGYDSLNDPQAYIDVNIDGTARLIDTCHRAGTPRIVFASSSTVYGSNSGPDLTEAVAPAPLSVYALSKLAGEHLLRMYSELHGFSHCSLRLFNVYGPRQAKDHPYANVTCKFSYGAAAGEPVQLFGDGEQSRDFVFVDDVVRAFLAVLESSSDAIYNVGTGRDRRINDLLTELETIGGKPLEVERMPPWPNDIRRISADTSTFDREFRPGNYTDLREGLTRTVEFFREELQATDA